MQHDIDADTRHGVTSEEHDQIKELKARSGGWKKKFDLEGCDGFFAAELAPATADHGVHRHNES